MASIRENPEHVVRGADSMRKRNQSVRGSPRIRGGQGIRPWYPREPGI